MAEKMTLAQAELAQREREQMLIQRDREDWNRELIRAAAELDVGNGKTVSIADAVVEPTREWLEKGPVQTFTPRLERGTVKTVTAYRRVLNPIINKLLQSGKINDQQYDACTWYRAQYEMAGLSGRVKSTNFSLSGGAGGGGSGQAPMALAEFEAIARDHVRTARSAIAPVLLRMFDAVVLEDLPLRRAERFVRCRNGQVLPRFHAACNDLVDYCQRVGVAIPAEDETDG